MTKRIQVIATSYLPLDGQWQIVYPGSVIDIADSIKVSPSNATVLSETSGSVPSGQTHASVRNVRVR